MNELQKQIIGLINGYFDKKVENVNWYSDLTAKLDICDIVTETLRDIVNSIKVCESDIDEYMEDFEKAHTKERNHELKLIKDDMRTQDEMEESLWNN